MTLLDFAGRHTALVRHLVDRNRPEKQGMTSESARSQGMRRRRTQVERRDEAEERMLEAARRLIGSQGPNRVSLADIGVEAGYSRGQPTHHFGSRRNLLRALALDIQDRFRREMAAAVSQARGLKGLRELIAFYFGRTDPRWTNTRAALVLLVDGLLEGSEIADIMSEYNAGWMALIGDRIREGIEDGEIRADADPAAQASLLFGALRGVLLQYLIDPRQVDLKLTSVTMTANLEAALTRR